MKIRKTLAVLLTAALTAGMLAGCGAASQESGSAEDKKDSDEITFVLDWTPNTNHTGVYVADSLGYFEEEGLDVEIVQPPDDGAEVLVGSGKAEFGVSFQDTMSSIMTGGTGKGDGKAVPITAVAAIIQHNTSGIMSKQGNGITSPKGMEGKTYATWEWDIEQAIIKKVMEDDGGDFSKVELIPQTVDDEVAALTAGKIQSIWVYYAWGGISAEVQNFPIDYFAFRDINEIFDYYSPVIIANDEYLEEHPDQAKAFLRAVRKGYEYAIANPDKAADILCEEVPELASNKELVVKSQEYLADQYQADAAQWGVFDAERWNAFYRWINENELLESKLPENVGFTNNYIQ